MYHETHMLREEFPQEVDKLQTLMLDDEEFLKLAAEYTEVNRKILQIEHEERHASDFHLEELKKLRLALKDQVAARLQH
ncbi:hypothetical protein SAMN04515647_4638 [Cohaesibacter sp. ES.047]|uniref:YdcH family protein n=1 Tax=Cohaesibacter sp. ES.047 TaxID=1798205 RepID=UPI000BB915C0|nr:DUF465 domain-containing protein [Cohaesibacter sp. ES.047]SNY94315.1 hypothetical protein SAMN04515647_4638 [Cohaesibacter sp. ES.047]